ncbi:solute carrier family 26 member 6-like [Paramacrobiotus metropolitanus]|uniref:solute carrier family 26 member 6-like n=1 Tax=Paramacrobiotus metropolitanus TaxID=2943436 RepID=UPI002445DC92|nr:solute carrier family 26 member 6-like [Paramacrobiotus metropolitanus]
MNLIRSSEEDSNTHVAEEPVANNRSGGVKRPSRFSISRPIFSQAKFDDNNESGEHGTPATPWTKLKRQVSHKIYRTFNSRTNCARIMKKKILRTFPILQWMPRYNVRQDLLRDLVAGLTVGIMNIPQGMAYGKLSGVPHVFGLYTSFFPLLIYTLMGTSRHVSVGTFAVVSLMTSKIVKQYEGTEADHLRSRGLMMNTTGNLDAEDSNLPARVGVLITVAFAVGLWQAVLGIVGLGSLTVYLSDQLVKGFTSGASFHVFSSQLKPVFGMQNLTSHYGAFKLFKTYSQFFVNLATHDVNVATLIISLICIVSLLLVKYLVNENKKVISWIKFPLPAELLIVIFGTLASWSLDLNGKYKVVTVRKVPVGMPEPQVPDMVLLPQILVDTFAVAVVGFTITVSLAKLFAQRFKYEIDPNQELKALGVTNIFCSFFQCIPATGSLARSAVQVAVGGATQVVSIIAALFVLVVLLKLGTLLESLPEACLGSIIMVALINMLKQISEVTKLWSISFVDTSVLLVSFLAVIILDVDSGLGIGVGYSLLTVIFRTQRPEIGLLGRVPQTDIYKRIDSYRTAMEVPNMKIIRLDAPLYFANADFFRRTTYELCGLDGRVDSQSDLRASPIQKHPKYRSLSDTQFAAAWNDQEVDLSSSSSIRVIQPNSASSDSSVLPGSPVPLIDLSDHSVLLGAATRYLVFDCSAVCFMDITGAEMLKKMAQELNAMGVEFFLAACKASARETLALSGFEKTLGPDRLYLTVHDAVLYSTQTDPNKSSTSG